MMIEGSSTSQTALNHADQMRLANLINDNSDDAEIQKKIVQVVELTSSTRDQAAVALHDCHYDVEKAVDMILEGDHANVESQWKSAGKKKNKNPSSQTAKFGAQSSGTVGGGGGVGHHHHHHSSASGTGSNHNKQHNSSSFNNKSNQANSGSSSSNNGPSTGSHSGGSNFHQQHHQQSQHPHHNTTNKNNSQANVAAHQAAPNQFNNNSSNKQDIISDSIKNLVGISSSNLISSSDPTTASTTSAPTKTSTLQKERDVMQQQQQSSQQQPQQQQPSRQQRGPAQSGSRQHQRSTRIPDSAVEMPNNELQVSSLNVQFGELDLRDGAVGVADAKGTFQDVLDSNRLGRQSGLPNSHSSIPSQDNKSNRQIPQHLGKGGPRRPYNNNNNSNHDDRKLYNSSNRGRQISGNQRPYNQRSGPMNNSNSSRGVRTILNRGLQPSSTMSNTNSSQASSGFPNSIDTWTNSTAEAATKPANAVEPPIGVGATLRVGQWSDVAGNEDWSEEDWDAKVMETKVFTPSSKSIDGPVASQKPLLTDSSVQSQINLSSKLSETVRDDVSSQPSSLNAVTQPGQSQQTSQKQLPHMNDIFDATAKAVLEQQNLASIKPKTSIGMSQYTKENSDSKTVLDQQNLSSIKPKTTMSMNQYNKEASESLKSLVGISSAKSGVPSVPPGALPLMSQPQYIVGNYQPAIFPYAYQTPDVHYQVAAPTAAREQSFQSVYSPSDVNKFTRGTDGDAPSMSTTQAAPVASQTHNQAFVANALHAGYQLTYAMPGAFNMMPQNLYGAAPIFPHIPPQPTNAGSANTVYQKNTAASYQHHAGYSAGYDQLNPLIQDYVKQHQNYSGSSMQQQQQLQQQQQQQQQQQPTSKSSGMSGELDVTSGGNSYNMYGSVNKGQTQASKQGNYNETKGYQQQMSGNGPQQQFGFSHNAQQPSSIAGYPLLQTHNLDGSGLGAQSGAQQQHSSAQRGTQINQNKYYPNWN